ncbi:MAG: hypothetical protein Q9165_005788 [Trypethelium subeluteriae]
MHFTTSTLVLASAALLFSVDAAPTSQNDTTSDKPVINVAQSNVTTTPTNQDAIIKILQDNNHIQWQPHNNGHYVDIPIDIWQKAAANASTAAARVKRSDNENLLLKRGGGGGDTGSISGYAGNIACYGSGSKLGLSVLNDYIVDGCEGLLANTLPPLALKTLRVFNSAGVSDWSGKAAYIRFSTELLSNGAPTNTGLCEAALQKFNSFCEGDGQQTTGGEVTVGGTTKYNMDPTDLDCNC